MKPILFFISASHLKKVLYKYSLNVTVTDEEQQCYHCKWFVLGTVYVCIVVFKDMMKLFETGGIPECLV